MFIVCLFFLFVNTIDKKIPSHLKILRMRQYFIKYLNFMKKSYFKIIGVLFLLFILNITLYADKNKSVKDNNEVALSATSELVMPLDGFVKSFETQKKIIDKLVEDGILKLNDNK